MGWFYSGRFIFEDVRIDQKNSDFSLSNSKHALCCRGEIKFETLTSQLPQFLMNQLKTWDIPDVLRLWDSDSNSTVSNHF